MGPPPRQVVGGGPHGVAKCPNLLGQLGVGGMARYSGKAPKPDKFGQWNHDGGGLMVCDCLACRTSSGEACEQQFELPRTCKGPCKREKPAKEFLSKDGKNYTQWCGDCRYARFLFLKSQRRMAKVKAPTITEFFALAFEYGQYVDINRERADKAWKRLRELQEEYTWTAERKR